MFFTLLKLWSLISELKKNNNSRIFVLLLHYEVPKESEELSHGNKSFWGCKMRFCLNFSSALHLYTRGFSQVFHWTIEHWNSKHFCQKCSINMFWIAKVQKKNVHTTTFQQLHYSQAFFFLSSLETQTYFLSALCESLKHFSIYSLSKHEKWKNVSCLISMHGYQYNHGAFKCKFIFFHQ